MIDSVHPVSINGVTYRLAEASEGEHYVAQRRALRPANSVVVQGEDPAVQRFQMRSDVLVWSLTDWSGGEGQFKYDPRQPNRHLELFNVEPFDRAGNLMPGYKVEATLNSASVILADEMGLALCRGKIIGISLLTAARAYTWGSEKWNAVVTLTGPTALPTPSGVTGDAGYVYFVETGTKNIWRWDETTSTQMTNTSSWTGDTSASWRLLELGNYLYLIDYGLTTGSGVWEITKTGAFPLTSTFCTNIDPYRDGGAQNNGMNMATIGANRIYTAAIGSGQGYTTVREITPTTAAGPGFAKELARFPGFVADSIWWHNGTIFVAGFEGSNADKRAILYVEVASGSYGTIGYVRHPLAGGGAGRIGAENAGGGLLTTSFVLEKALATTHTFPAVYEIDRVSGGMSQIALADMAPASAKPISPVVFQGDYFFSSFQASSRRVYRMWWDIYEATSSWAISPWWDFALASDKVLSSISLSVESLPANWSVQILYGIDGQSTYTSAGTYNTTSGDGTTFQISSAGATVPFKQLRLKILFSFSGGDSPTTRPVVSAVEVRAQVAKKQKAWQLLLDLGDDYTAASKSNVGLRKLQNLESAADGEVVVTFLDGYRYPQAGDYDTYSVIVDEVAASLNRPGEGFAQVSLVEVS